MTQNAASDLKPLYSIDKKKGKYYLKERSTTSDEELDEFVPKAPRPHQTSEVLGWVVESPKPQPPEPSTKGEVLLKLKFMKNCSVCT